MTFHQQHLQALSVSHGLKFLFFPVFSDFLNTRRPVRGPSEVEAEITFHILKFNWQDSEMQPKSFARVKRARACSGQRCDVFLAPAGDH